VVALWLDRQRTHVAAVQPMDRAGRV
jgi:hypothetical protein